MTSSLLDKVPQSAESTLDCEENKLSCPVNWNPRKKILHTTIPSLLAFLMYVFFAPTTVGPDLTEASRTFGISVSGPARSALMTEFEINRTTALLSITLYTEGLALGPLLFAPLSEIYGRRWVYVGASRIIAIILIRD
jgi:MFS family permease